MSSKVISALLLPCALAAPKSLYQSAEGLGVYIGTAVNVWEQSTTQYVDLEIQNYNLVTAESSCKMKQIAKSSSNFDYTLCNKVRDFAKTNDQAFRAHNLIWATHTADGRNPSFVNNMNKTQITNYMYSYIGKTVRAIGNYPIAWDVINEYVSDKNNEQFKISPWSQIPDFGCQAFRAATKAAAAVQGSGPKMGMFYNDYDILSMSGWAASKSDKVFDFVKDLKQRGCGITGIGMQAHINTDFDLWSGIAPNFQRYADIGIDVHITELDIQCTHCGNTWSAAEITQQRKVYTQLLNLCLLAENCRSFETWGFTDKYSWLANPKDGLIFNRSYVPKEAYYSINAMLHSFPRGKPGVIARNKAIAAEGRVVKGFQSVSSVESEAVQSFLQ